MADQRQQEEEERWRWRLGRRGGDVVGMSRGERFLELMERSCCRQFCMGPNPWMARYVYGLIFLVTNLLAWVVRDYAQAALSDLKSDSLNLIKPLSFAIHICILWVSSFSQSCITSTREEQNLWEHILSCRVRRMSGGVWLLGNRRCAPCELRLLCILPTISKSICETQNSWHIFLLIHNLYLWERYFTS